MSNVRILVVEDERTVAMEMQSALTNMGYVVLAVVPSPASAIEKAAEIRPDLVLMDIRQDGSGDSAQAAECIWNRLDIPVVYLAAHSDDNMLPNVVGAAPQTWITKPIEKQKLQSAIEMALHGRQNTRSYQETIRRLREAETLSAATATLTRLIDMDQVLRTIVKSAIHLIPVSTNAVIHLTDPATDKLVPRASSINGDAHSKIELTIGQGIIGLAVREKRLINVSDVEADPRILVSGSGATRKSMLIAPLMIDGDCIGVLSLNSDQVNGFTSDDERVLVTWAAQAATAIRNARLHREVQRRANELSFLNRIGRAVTSSLDPQQILTTAMEEATQVLGTEACSVLLRDEQSGELVFEATVGPELKGMKGLRLSPGEGIAGWVAEQGRPSFANRVRGDTRFCPDVDIVTGFVTRSVLAIPLTVRGKLIGVIEAVNKKDGDFDQADIELLSAMSQWVAIAVQNADLFAETQQRYQELKRTQAELIQTTKMAAVGQLAAGVAHDFNNLLTVITGYSDLMIESPEIGEPVRADMRMIRETADRASSLTNQLLAFSRKQVLQPKILDVNTLLLDMEKMLRRLIGEDITLGIHLSPAPGVVKVDPGQIEQVIMNLVVNARDAMPKGGNLSITVNNVILDETYSQFDPESRPGAFVCLSVADTGIGMDEETIQRIFEPFFTTKEMGRGTGLGLSVIYGIVRQHEGWINICSKPGAGSTFKVFLPVCTAGQIDQSREKILPPALHGNQERILLVEDADDVRGFVARALCQHGYVVYDTEDAEEALRIFAKERKNFSLVFSDVILPDKSGIELVDELLSRKPEIRVLLSSGYTNEKIQWPVILERGFHFLPKPYTLTKLLAAIKEALHTDQPRRQEGKC